MLNKWWIILHSIHLARLQSSDIISLGEYNMNSFIARKFLRQRKQVSTAVRGHVFIQMENGKNFSLQFILFIFPPIRKIENNSHIHDKRETTHFDVETANGKIGIFAVCGKNKRDALFL